MEGKKNSWSLVRRGRGKESVVGEWVNGNGAHWKVGDRGIFLIHYYSVYDNARRWRYIRKGIDDKFGGIDERTKRTRRPDCRETSEAPRYSSFY
ncbi:MAG: hypothetical protein V2I33_23520 [Kangiellaceae bacterium]|jgi:hypothetical protein|nr:hypothetical protein [Kangiellaceae bacterium]